MKGVRVPVLDILREFVAFPHARRGRPIAPGEGLRTLAYWSASLAGAVRHTLFAAGASPRPRTEPLQAWAFTRKEAEVLSLVQGVRRTIRLVQGDNPVAIWPRAALGRARVRAAVRLARAALGPDAFELWRLGERVRHAMTALAEQELHERSWSEARPQAVLVANDHSPRSRGLLLLAAAHGVRTVYIQHAAVGGYESAIIADRSLLHGEDSAIKYLAQGRPRGTVLVIGALEAAEMARLRREAAPRAVGLCPSLNDTPGQFETLLRERLLPFSRSTGAPLLLRFHPRDDRRRSWEAMCRRCGVGLIDPARTSTATYVAGLAALVSGDSNIALEALAAGCPVFLSAEPGALTDQYGMIGRGLVPPLSELDAATLVSAPRPSPSLARYVHAAGWEPEALLNLAADLCENPTLDLVDAGFSPSPRLGAEVWVLRPPARAAAACA